MDNPAVREENDRSMGFWPQLGVAGFRVDAVSFILESPVAGKKEYELRFEYLSEMRRFLQWRQGDAVLLGEANVLPEESNRYFGPEGSGIQLMFNFFVNQHPFYALATSETEPLVAGLEATRSSFPIS